MLGLPHHGLSYKYHGFRGTWDFPGRLYSQGRPREHKRRAAKAHEQVLLCLDTIRHTEANGLTTTSSAEQKARGMAASGFFRQSGNFLYSAASLKDHPFNDQTPEVVVLGASNVGKSTFLNALMGSEEIARVSQKPGHTTLMNAYGVGPPPRCVLSAFQKGSPRPNHSLVIMDTPGYGFKSQSDWGTSIMRYLETRRMLRGAVLLLSSEKKLLSQDRWLLRALADSRTRTLIILTRADKNLGDWQVKCSDLARAAHEETRLLGEQLCRPTGDAVLWSSEILITAARIGTRQAPRIGGGMGAARVAILDMAGLDFCGPAQEEPEKIAYSGDVVSFEDVTWKT